MSSPVLLLTYSQLSSKLVKICPRKPKMPDQILQLCSFYCKGWLGNALTPLCQVCTFQLLPRTGAKVMSWILPLITFSILLLMSCLYHPLPEITAWDWRWLEPWLKTWTIPFLRTFDFVGRLTMQNPWWAQVQTTSDVQLLLEKYLVKKVKSEKVCRLVLEDFRKHCLTFRYSVLCATLWFVPNYKRFLGNIWK